MPSIKKRVTGFIRQISGPSQSEVRAPVSPPPQYEKCFIQRYLAGETRPKQPDIHYAKTGHSLPSHQLGYLHPEVFSAYTGPDGGITCISRTPPEALDKSSTSSEVDYIDLDDGRVSRNLSRRASVAADMVETFERGVRCHINPDPGAIRVPKSPVYIDNTVMTIRVMDRVYRVDDTNKRVSSSSSKTSDCSPSPAARGSVSSAPESLSSISSARGSMSSEDEPVSPLYKTSDIIDIDDQLDLIETEDGYLPIKSIRPSEISQHSKRVTISSPVKPVPRPNFLDLAVVEQPPSSQLEDSHANKKSLTKSVDPPASVEKSFDESCRISLEQTSKESKSSSVENGENKSNKDGNRSSQNKESVKMSNDYPELKSNQMAGGVTPNAVMIEQTENIINKLKIDLKDDISISRAGVRHWNRPNCSSFGISDSLYERNPVSGEQAGSPIADTFAVVARKNSALLVLGDGVNWGARAALASRAAVYGAMDYLNTALFGVNRTRKLSTQDVFQILLRSFHAAHCLIIEEDAMLTTLTAAVVLPTENDKFHFCVCNVGDSLAYVYSKGEVREVTQGSHDITANRDMRDALGALGPVDGLNPELSNLTCSITEVLPGDIVFLTSDGISDNFDPVVGKFCVPKKPERTSSQKMGANFPRSRKTSEADTLPTVEGFQRHELTLLRIEDILNHDWGSNSVLNSGSERVDSAAELCQRMLDFCQRLTTAKRKILEDPELYPENDSDMQDQKIRRRRVCEKLALVPGKLDHATIAAYQVGDRIQELQDFRGDLTDTVGRTTPGLVLSAPHASCEDLTMRDSPDDDDVTPTPSISLDSTPLASGASSLAATPTHTPRI